MLLGKFKVFVVIAATNYIYSCSFLELYHDFGDYIPFNTASCPQRLGSFLKENGISYMTVHMVSFHPMSVPWQGKMVFEKANLES
jgi:hypothetical protein